MLIMQAISQQTNSFDVLDTLSVHLTELSTQWAVADDYPMKYVDVGWSLADEDGMPLVRVPAGVNLAAGTSRLYPVFVYHQSLCGREQQSLRELPLGQ